MSNRLKNEKSLYLQQHANNPVQWQPWGDEALDEARMKNLPLLVSIGYSACHWCHVMAHECFEDPYIAGIMNRHFICIKVDREERPDLDQIYMDAVQMITKQGGWPLNVFCLPDGRPFFGGTYFPPKDRKDGLIPWPQLLMRVADHYKRKVGDLENNARAILGNLDTANRIDCSAGWKDATLLEAAKGISGTHDDRYGGFGDAPKFPQPMALNFLDSMSRSAAVKQDPGFAERLQTILRQTLTAMAHGGIYDQFGGGFARYSVDAHWLVPHFEKMLYDNAQLIEAYTRVWKASAEPLFAKVVEETIEFLDREMAAPGGGFHAALDADSDGAEGSFYVWSPEDIRGTLGAAKGREICAAYHITEEGTFEDGKSIPALVEGKFEVRESLAAERAQLLKIRRTKRQAPGKDRKISLAWNALTIRAIAAAGFTFNRPDWLARAARAAEFAWDAFSREVRRDRRLLSVHYDVSGARVNGFLHDYALLAEACLELAATIDWIEPGESARYIERAKRLTASVMKHFSDPDNAGYFYTADDAETAVLRRKEWFDNATPSGNASMLNVLCALHALTGESIYADEIRKLSPAYTPFAQRSGSAVAHALGALSEYSKGIVVIKAAAGSDLETLRAALANKSWQRTFVLISKEVSSGYQLCIGTQCLEPSRDLDALLERLG